MDDQIEHEYGYEDYIKHLKEQCTGFRIYKCENQCNEFKKMDYHALLDHYRNECTLMLLECKTCRNTAPRQ